MKHSVTALLLALTLPVISCSGKTVLGVTGSEKTSVRTTTTSGTASDIRKVEASGVVDVIYTQYAGTASYTVTCPEEYSDNLVVNVSGNKIKVYIKDGVKNRNDTDPKVTLNLKSAGITDIELSGVSCFTTDWLDMTGQDVEIDLSGVSSVKIDSLTAAEVDVEVSGAGGFNCTRLIADYGELEASGASGINVENGDFKTVKLSVSGASGATMGGTAETGIFQSSGASRIDVGKMKVTQSSVNSSGVSSITSPKKK
ncbi:MAG: hypothetical protein HDR80_10435 [Bacteroides sp.]|nr:hypothetical protein [Bacteroides sp.]